jgi:hypothetical protein
MVSAFNDRSFWVASEVLRRIQGDVVGVAKRIATFIRIMEQCAKLANYFSVFAISNGLGLAPVFRLKAAWALLSTKDKHTYKRIAETITDRSKNFAAYRTKPPP